MLGEILRAEEAVLVLVDSLEDGFRSGPLLKTDLAIAVVILERYRPLGILVLCGSVGR